MRLKPPIFSTPATQVENEYGKVNTFKEPSKEAIDEILTSSGFVDTLKNSDDPNSQLKYYFNDKGGRLEDVAAQIVNIMCRGESETARLSAAKFIAELQGVQTTLENIPQVRDVTINIIGSENKTLINLIMPKG